ncbi:MAG: deaminase [Candidatus Woesearchaeota archaeon]
MIVGVTGGYCSGKDTVAQYLADNGFTHISLSDFLRAELRLRKKEITRENLIAVGKELREKFGHAALANMALESMEIDKKYVVSSIRHPAEVEALRKRRNFILVYVDAPAKERFRRMVGRQKPGEELPTFSDFLASEKREMSEDPSAQQLHKVFSMANLTIKNDGTIEQLYAKIDKFLKMWKPRLDKRPNWDEYFMGIVKQVGRRGTCDRGKSGAVIVKDKRLLSTGYVGSPVGIEHCDEVGHQMHKVTNPDGTTSQHCIRTAHAEQNAIVQAARYGIAIDGSTIYCKMEPCYTCAKMIINAGIKRVVCEKKYHGAKLSREILKKAGVKLDVLYEEVEKYPNQ